MDKTICSTLGNAEEYFRSYDANDRQDRIKAVNLGCWLVVILMPAGALLDYFVYPEMLGQIFTYRIASSIWAGVILGLMCTSFGQKWVKYLGVMWIWIPSMSMGWMIYATEGSTSPYYAGQTLAMLVVFTVIPWTYRASTISCLGIMAIYAVACFLHTATPFNMDVFVSNCYFLLLTTIICVSASLAAHKIRVKKFDSEMRLRVQKNELEHTKDELELTLYQLKETESQLIESEKMKILNLLSSGLLHEINNPLNTVSTALAVIEKINDKRDVKLEPDLKIEARIKDLKKNVGRVIRTVSSLRTFAHPSAKENSSFKLTEVFDMSLSMCSDVLRDVTLEKHIDKDLMIQGKKDQLSLMFVNIFSNAAKALADRENPTIIVKGRKGHNGNNIISIWDNGLGIEKNVIDNIFEPLFTTKDNKSSMGLGLSMCRQVVAYHNGDIKVDSEFGKWTEFTIILPEESIEQGLKLKRSGA